MKHYILLFLLGLGGLFMTEKSSAQCVDDFQVFTSSGETVVNLCVGAPDAIFSVAADQRGFPIMYILTDNNGAILESTTNPVFDFRNAPPGTCRIYAATFKGFIRNTYGEPIESAELTSLCWGLSNNYVTVIRGTADESTVSIAGGGQDTTVCSLDAQDDIIAFDHSATGQSYAYLIVDENNVILGVTTDEANFEGAPAGICYVYGISYDGMLLAEVGMTLGDVLAEGCYLLSDNAVRIERVTTDAGRIMTADSLTQLVICIGDSIADSTLFITPGRDSSANYRFIITDDNDSILAVQETNVIDFNGAPEGICRIYGVAYLGDLTATVGQHLSSISSDGACLGLTPNYVRVLRTQPMEGPLTTISGDTVVNTCPGDSIDDIVSFSIMSGTSPYMFIVTDENNRVLALSQSQSINFENATPGNCLVWRVAYTGALTIAAGDELFVDPVSDGCYVISDNAVLIVRKTPEAGEIVTAGLGQVYVCGGDGVEDRYVFDVGYAPDVPFTLVVTDDNGVVRDLLDAADTLDLTNAPSGTCFVYGLSYHGALLIAVGQDIDTDPIASACHAWTANAVEFNRNNVNPGMITSQYGTVAYTWPGDGNPDIIFITRESDADTSVIVITDDQGVVQDITTDTILNLDGAGEGVCQIWNLAFSGDLLINIGDTVAGHTISTGCSGLSDPITVYRKVPYTDALTTIEGDTMREFCTTDNNSDIVVMRYAPADEFPIAYVVTSSTGVILATSSTDTLNFTSAPAGTCRVYAVAYTGAFQSNIGLNIGAAFFSNDCFAISDNYVEIIKSNPAGGQLADANGETTVYICLNDTVVEYVHFVRTGGSGAEFQYIVTDSNDIILEFPAADSMDFENAPAGICRIWGVAYSGQLLAEVGDTLSTTLLSDECYALTNNFIEIVRTEAEAGNIATMQGDTLVTTITGDTITDIVTAVADGISLANGRYVITNQANIVIVVLTENEIDFSIVPVGEYRIYYVSYTGSLLLSAGDNLFLEPISDGCSDVSDNFIRVMVGDNLQDDDGSDLRSSSAVLQLRTYPNPAIDEVVIQTNENADEIIVMNALGRVVYVDKNPRQFTSLAISNWERGIYVVHSLVDGKAVGSGRFIKQ